MKPTSRKQQKALHIKPRPPSFLASRWPELQIYHEVLQKCYRATLMEPAQEIWSVQHWCRAFLWHLGGLPLPSLPVHWRKTVTVTCSGWRTWWQISWQLRTKKSPIECPRLASELHLAAWSDLCQEILPQVQSMQANSHPSPAEHHHSCWMQSGTQEIARRSQQTATSMPSIRRAPRQ